MEYYSINDIALFTGLTDRTLREHIKKGILQGEKSDGAWRFSKENFQELMENPAVRKSIKARKNAAVYDFLLQNKKSEDEACVVFDFAAEDERAKDISDFFCRKVNAEAGNVSFNFEWRGKNARVILTGNPEAVLKIAGDFYK